VAIEGKSREGRVGGFLPAGETRDLGVLGLLWLVGSLLVGVAVGLLLLSRIFVSISTDASRLGVLLQALQNAKSSDLADGSPRVVIFGNSVLMSGIDARQLAAELPGSPLSWNASSTGQTVAEAFLLTQELPDSVEIAVYGVQLRAGSQESPLAPHKYNTLYLNGFRPSPPTRAVLGGIYGSTETAVLDRTHIQQVFASRWAIRQFVDTATRMLLRPDLAIQKATSDLYHPQSYTRPIDRDIVTRFIGRRLGDLAERPATTPHGVEELAHSIANTAAEQGRRTVFLLPPLHPWLLHANAAGIGAAAKKFQSVAARLPRTQTIVATSLLDESHFVDDMHPTNEGAALLTAYVATALAGD
jgi:hypothetical protein